MMQDEEERVLASIQALEPTVERDAPTDQWSDEITALMLSVPVTPAWLARLVAAFAGTQNPGLANSLAFVLAGAANHQDRVSWVAPLAIEAMVRIDVPSPWPRLNLCTTVDRLLMFKGLPPELGRPVPGLGRLLLESMDGNNLLQAVAALVSYQLRCLRMEDAVSDADRGRIEEKVLSCTDSPNDELADYARALRDHIEQTSTIV